MAEATHDRPRAELVRRYQEIRQAGIALGRRIMPLMEKRDAETAGRVLGLLRGKSLVIDSDEVGNVFTDYCLFDVRRDGLTAVERFASKSPRAEGSLEGAVLQGLLGARFTLLVVESCDPGVGVHCHDLLTDAPEFVHDLGLSHTARPGVLIAARLVSIDGIVMTSGLALPFSMVPREERATMLKLMLRGAGLRSERGMTPVEASRFAAFVIRTALEAGAGERVRYTDSRDNAKLSGPPAPHSRDAHRSSPAPVPSSPPSRVPRNASCPCGSGRKFKHCCGGT